MDNQKNERRKRCDFYFVDGRQSNNGIYILHYASL